MASALGEDRQPCPRSGQRHDARSRHRTDGVVVGRSGQAPHHPPFAKQTFRSWFKATENDRATTGDPVLLFVDSFTNYFTPEVGHATVRVLELPVTDLS